MIKKNLVVADTFPPRHNLFILALKHLPLGYLATAIGIAALAAPLVFNALRDRGVSSFLTAALLTGAIVVIVPLFILYLVTLLRAPRIRSRAESEAERELEIMTKEMEALKIKEKKEEDQIHALEQVIHGDLEARKKIEAKTDDRWEDLTESIRLQKETAELAAEETVLAAKQVKEIKDEGEVALTEYTADETTERQNKAQCDEDHWKALEERMSIQEEKSEQREVRSEEREQKQELREEEFIKMKQAELLKK